MKMLTSKSALRAVLATSVVALIALFATDSKIAYSSDDQQRDDQRRQERRDQERRDDQQRDERIRDNERYDQRRDNQRGRQNDAYLDDGPVKSVRNLHPELQIASPRELDE